MNYRKKRKKLPVILYKHEQKEILKQFNFRYWSSQRNYTLIRIFLDLGLRKSEALNLTWNDIDLLAGILHVIEGKYGVDRNLYLSTELISLLGAWRERQTKKIGSQEFVFTTGKGKQLNPRYINEMIDIYSRRAKIEKNVTPHTFRHSFATDLLRKCKDLTIVQRVLGHSDITTTTIYTHTYNDDVKDALVSLRS